ncbi:MAG: FMN-binding protein [Proteobacteria bacterium]|nr:FMN-binding protein [Pseudomonadota bacterium]
MKERLMIAAVLLLVSIASALSLAAINNVSFPVIQRNQERQFKVALLKALEIPFDSEMPEKAYNIQIEEKSTEEGTLYLTHEDNQKDLPVTGVAFMLKGAGFWGPLSLIVGLDPADMSIRGLEIFEQEETPGLGARIEEKAFRDQFKGKQIEKKIIVQIKGAATGPNDVSAITGATITSKTLEKIINETSRPYIEAMRSLNNG